MSFVSDFFGHSVIQSGVAPFFAAFFVVLVLHRLKLGGLALVAAFYMAAWLIGDLAFQPLTVARKIVLISLVTPLLGMCVDFMARGSPMWRVTLALLSAAASIWVYWPVLAQKPMAEAVLYGGGAALLLSWLVSATLTMHGWKVGLGFSSNNADLDALLRYDGARGNVGPRVIAWDVALRMR